MTEKLFTPFAHAIFESPRKYLYRLIFIIIMGIAFTGFPMPTHFLGDGYALLNNLGAPSSTFIKWTEKGMTIILISLQSLLGGRNNQTALITYRILSVLSGAVTVWFYFLIARIISDNRKIRILTFFGLFLSGTLLLFFGYVENYPLLWISVTGYIYYSLRYLNDGRGVGIVAIFLGLGLFIHLQIAVFIPSFIYLIFSKGRGLMIYRRFRPLIWGIATIVIILGIVALIRKYSSNLYFESIFLPLFSGRPKYPYYLLLSSAHIIDLVNQLLLLSPALPLLFYFSLGGWKNQWNSQRSIFISIFALAGLAFITLVDPTLGMARDWDLFSLGGIGLTLMFVLIFPKIKSIALDRLLLPIILYLLAAILPYLITNLRESSSLEYAKAIVNVDKGKSYSTIGAIKEYYAARADTMRIDSVSRELYLSYPNRLLIGRAISATHEGRFDIARNLLTNIEPDKYDAQYHDLLAGLYFQGNNYPLALTEINKAVQLQEYNPQFHMARAVILSQLGQNESALKAYRRAYQLNHNDLELLYKFSHLFYDLRQYDSAAFYGKIIASLDSARPEPFYFLARVYIKTQQLPDAREAYSNYVRFGSLDTLLNVHKILLLQKIDSLERALPGKQ